MTRVTGAYAVIKTHDETVRAFVPAPLPPAAPVLDPAAYLERNRLAEVALARLTGMAGLVASSEWLIYSAVRQEALLTSQLEGTQATLTDVFDDEAGLAVTNADDVEEVTNYLQAFKFVREQLHAPTGLPISLRLLAEAHRILLAGVRGAHALPGSMRTSQNWIGGTRPGNAAFVPPPADRLAEVFGDLERFIHDPQPTLPPLVRIALVHAQFETIHPFLDDNGRIGRLLIAALLEDWQLLSEPLLYVSGYLKANQNDYYRHLSAIRTHGDWEAWVGFFLEAVEASAEQAQRSIVAIAALIAADRKRVLSTGSSTLQALRLFELLPTMPKLTVDRAQQALEVSYPTARAAVTTLQDIGVLVETTGRARGQSFSYQAYVNLLRA
ncbi:Fic family protein [Xanthomonas hortorum]|uniref:Protein adenylyltransferase n=1 Tax=Xanthomonas hortorum pv. pelargonii TaxID=453602 RepID=A0A6V7B7X3_9XANT|nr:Fic family protein [Xanthomonas hortorum]MCE4355375.1 Fic family protein [Xanthomonas hortorum pv. pelargonii]MCM5523974.1 Fic family protein [Xanthomonas hortorum pv. pelargonii]MCM5536207.1 Fic family protein [Xanthomonas hortorum pv. pelargonii]MCM5540389.1 Fic family protein [Xanthomonas hortorum pv. pelargonii]MCM5543819.1 Fic family protein [Xanthomonas hortorum pv. pelargonii]